MSQQPLQPEANQPDSPSPDSPSVDSDAASNPLQSEPPSQEQIDEAAQAEQAIASASGAVPAEDVDDIWDAPAAPPSPAPKQSSRPVSPGAATPRSKPFAASPSVLQRATGLLNTSRSALETLLDKSRPLIDQALGAIEKSRPLLKRVQDLWGVALAKLRTILPASLNQILPDKALTGAIAGILVLLLSISSNIGSKPAQVSQAPSAPPQNSPAEQPTVPSEVTTNGSTPSALDLAPDQSLIAAIQDQVAEVTNQYTDGLVQSIQANFRSSRLIVRVGEAWYELPQPRQDKLASEMLSRAKELDFNKLEITNIEGALLARSPVVGEEMIIFKRSL